MTRGAEGAEAALGAAIFTAVPGYDASNAVRPRPRDQGVHRVSARVTRSGVSAIQITEAGIAARSRAEVILDVAFDGRRVFSFWLHRDGTPTGASHLMPWPQPMRQFLNGATRLTLTIPSTGRIVYDDDVVLGAGTGRISVAGKDGRPLALDKSMKLSHTFDTRSSDHVEPLMNAIDDVLGVLSGLGVDAFIAYGTLLGAVRSGRLIGHDSDADLGYVSRYEHPVDVIRESFKLQRVLVERGYSVTRYSGSAFKVDVRESDGGVRGLDVFGGFMMDGRLHLMGEIRTPFKREWVTPLTQVNLEGRTFAAPANTDRFLAATYGKSWRVPDPAFHFGTPASTTRRFDGWFRGIRVGRSTWDRQYYGHPRARSLDPSDLVQWVTQRESEISHFVDLGCGYGTDAMWMARRGVHSSGLDFVRRAFTDQQAKSDGLPVDFHRVNLLELRSVLGTGALLAARPGPRVLMARHLADAVTAGARRNLWRLADMALRDGGRLYLEFLVSAGDDGFNRANKVRRIRGQMVADELVAAGATIIHREARPVGPAISDSEGPGPSKICRMVAEWQ